jgi:hypothetical protein
MVLLWKFLRHCQIDHRGVSDEPEYSQDFTMKIEFRMASKMWAHKSKKSYIAPEDQEMAYMRGRRGYQTVDVKTLKLLGCKPARS